MEAKTIAKAKLATITTAELIAQYELAISSYAGRLTNYAPRQKRIDYIVDVLSNRADSGDIEAGKWLAESE